jgi:hypothetical protein
MPSFSLAWGLGLASLLAISSAPVFAQVRTPQLLQFYRESPKAGAEQEYAKAAEDAARLCAQMHCPQAFVAIETINDPKEVWYLTPFDSQAHMEQIAAAYKQNAALTSAMGDLMARRQTFCGSPSAVSITNWLPVFSGGPPWSIPDARFLIITHTRGQPGAMGAVYNADDGSLFEIRPAATMDEAKVKFSAGDPNARIFEVQPKWSWPAKEWSAANPAVWGSASGSAR